jgi:hypothetical protein
MISREQTIHIGIIAAVLMVFLLPARALAQEKKDDVYVRVNGTADLPAGEGVGTLVAVNSPANVAGSVRDTLVVVNQNATVSGEVGRDVFVWNGTLRLEPSARIGGDVILANSQLSRAEGATIGGQVQERSAASISAEVNRAASWISLVGWLGITLLLVAVALGWAAIGGRQLSNIAGLLGARPGLAAGTAVIFWIAVPLLAILALVTVIGIPLGIAILLIGLPLMWGLGYVTTGTQLGFFFDDLRHAPPNLGRPYLEAVLGVIAFQLIGLIPIVGGIVVALAGLFGAGAIVVHAWRRLNDPRHAAELPRLDAVG